VEPNEAEMDDPAGRDPADYLDDPADFVPDDRLRLIFTCCHPALVREAQVALTLRLVCGVSTDDIARAFLVSNSTMAARVTRAKQKISAARIPFRVPKASEFPDRLDAVLSVIHLLYTTGHTAPSGDQLLRNDLADRALHLARMLHSLMPDEAEVRGLLALLLLTDARRATRTGDDGSLLRLAEQNRAAWDRAAIGEGVALVREALRSRPPGRYALQAAIAAVHAEAPSWDATDWAEVVALYNVLAQIWPSPVVALNRAVAVGFARGPAAGLAELDALAAEPQLAGYSYLPAARAEFLQQLGRPDEARTAYGEAVLLTENAVEQQFLLGRLAALDAGE
jgi:RNA polymerase sigma-70 factor (ECF subfamily)